MARYYYTDALKAAYMCREFGVYLYTPEDDIYQKEELNFHDMISSADDAFDHHAKPPYYVESEFDAIFKPQKGDIIICDHMGEVKEIYEIRDDWCSFSRDGGGCNFAGIREIIHRNGKAFFAPEVEGD